MPNGFSSAVNVYLITSLTAEGRCMQGEVPPASEGDDAALVSLIFETVYKPRSWAGLTEHGPPTVGSQALPAATIDSLVPFLQSALDAADQHVTSSSSMQTQPGLLQELPLPVCIVDTGLKVLSATSRAVALMNDSALLNVTGDLLSASDKRSQTIVSAHIHKAISENVSSVFRLASDAGEEIFLAAPIQWPRESDSTPAAALFLDLRRGLLDHLTQRLCQDYGLTRSEADVAALLSSGMSIEEIAAHKSVSQHTVRTQLKTVYGKTGTSRQAELVSVILNGPEALAGITQITTPQATKYDPPVVLDLGDNRCMSYAAYGPAGGQPVLLCHHLLGSRFDKPEDLELLDELNVRLVVPERPGYGQSTVVKNRTLKAWTDDVLQLVDHLQLSRFSVLGFSSGGPHGAACAAMLPERVTRLGLVASLMPVDELPDDVSVGMTHKFVTGMARKWPSGLRKLLSIRYANILASADEAAASFSTKGNKADVELLQDAQLQHIREQNVRRCRELDPSTFASELVMLFQPWGFSLADLEVPVHVWHGRCDDFFPADHAEAIARWLPQCRATIGEDWGHFFIYRHWREILTSLTS